MPLTGQAQSSALDGEWVGGFRIGGISGYLHFDVVSEGEQLRIVLGFVSPVRPQGSALRDLARDESVVRFWPIPAVRSTLEIGG